MLVRLHSFRVIVVFVDLVLDWACYVSGRNKKPCIMFPRLRRKFNTTWILFAMGTRFVLGPESTESMEHGGNRCERESLARIITLRR